MDPVLKEACKILRLLHLTNLRSLQNEINNTIELVQSATANPKTDTRLGKVGRWKYDIDFIESNSISFIGIFSKPEFHEIMNRVLSILVLLIGRNYPNETFREQASSI